VLAWGEHYKYLPEVSEADESAELGPFDRELLSSLDMKSVFDIIMVGLRASCWSALCFLPEFRGGFPGVGAL
jgi:hypothetical protein